MQKRKRIEIIIVMMWAFMTVGGCKATEEKGDGIQQLVIADTQKQEADTQREVLTAYYQMIIQGEDKEKLYEYVEEHVHELSPKNADQLVNGLLAFMGDYTQVDYTRLQKHEQYYSAEMQNFLQLMKQKQVAENMQREWVAQEEVRYLLLQAEFLEEHATTYPQGVTYPYVYDCYCRLLEEAVCHPGQDIPLSEGELVDEEIRTAYTEYVRAHPNSNISSVIREYQRLLQESDGIVTEKVRQFYKDFFSEVKSHFKI